jgi:hypothetical protein
MIKDDVIIKKHGKLFTYNDQRTDYVPICPECASENVRKFLLERKHMSYHLCAEIIRTYSDYECRDCECEFEVCTNVKRTFDYEEFSAILCLIFMSIALIATIIYLCYRMWFV